MNQLTIHERKKLKSPTSFSTDFAFYMTVLSRETVIQKKLF